jgi:hypothetical protein
MLSRATLLAVALFAPALSAQTTWYVDDSNASPGTGTLGDPFQTIQQGVAASAPNDTVQVAAGLYSGTVYVTIDNLAIVGAGAGSTILDATGSDAGFDVTAPPPTPARSGVRIEGLTVRNASRWQIVGWNLTSFTVRDVEVIGLGRNVPSPAPSTNAVYGVSLSQVTNSLVDGLYAHDCYAAGLAFTGGSTGNTVQDLTIDQCSADGGGFASFLCFTAPGVSIPGGNVGVTFAGTNLISNTPWAMYFEDIPGRTITTAGTSTLSLSNAAVPLIRVGLGSVPNLTALTTDLGIRVRLMGTEPALPTGEAYFSSFASAYAASLLGTTPATALIRALDSATFFVGVGMSIQLAINAAAPGESVDVGPGTFSANLVLAKALNLRGARFGVDARGRVPSSPPNPAVETVLTAASGAILTLQTGCAGASIDGFAFVGGARGIESTTGPLHGLAIRNNHMEGGTASRVFLNDAGTDLTVFQNVFRAESAAGYCFFLDADLFDGFWFLCNDVLRNGAATDTGFFVDGDRNVRRSASRAPRFEQNLFRGHGTGANLGSRATDDAVIRANSFTLNAFDGLQGGMMDAVIAENSFTSNGRSGLALTSFGNNNPLRGAQRCQIIGNTFSANAQEGLFFSATQAAGTISTNVAQCNSFAGNAIGARYPGGETIDCQNNWWNHPSGPSGAGSGSGDSVSGVGIDFTPWLGQAPSTPSSYAVGLSPLDVAVGDLSGDGRADIATANSGGHSVSVLTNDGLGGFPGAATTIALNPGDAPNSLAIGQLVAGGNAEIAVLAAGGNQVHVVAPGSGILASTSLPGSAGAELCVASLNGAGTADIAIAMNGSPLGGGGGLAVILDGGAPLLLAPPTPLATWPKVEAVVCCDLDGDGDLDLAATASANAMVASPGDVLLYANSGAGAFSYAGALSIGLAPTQFVLRLCCGDLDRNGRNDLAISYGDLAGGGGLARFLHDASSSMLPAAFALNGPTTSPRLPSALLCADLEEDSLPGYAVSTEVVAVNSGEGLFTVFNDFNGTSFGSTYACLAGISPTSVDGGDVDLDCLIDLVICDAASSRVIVIPSGGTALAQTYGTGCIGTAGVPSIGTFGLPTLGSMTFQITLASARPFSLAILIGGAGVGAPPGGCTGLLVDPALFFFNTFTSFVGSSQFPAAIPNDPFLDCGEFTFQWAVVDSLGGLGGAYSLSNGLRLRLGD